MTFPIIHRAITSLCRALGIVSSVDDVVIMPLGKWHEWHEEKERLRKRVEELEGQLAAVEQSTVFCACGAEAQVNQGSDHLGDPVCARCWSPT